MNLRLTIHDIANDFLECIDDQVLLLMHILSIDAKEKRKKEIVNKSHFEIKDFGEMPARSRHISLNIDVLHKYLLDSYLIHNFDILIRLVLEK